ncbi:hypothetical protein A7982_13137 [Minicystis rosea]|nr:hypothetical protein A7982_13137 [Minicystis rosea]
MRFASRASSIVTRRRPVMRRHFQSAEAREVARLRAHFRAALAEIAPHDVSHLDAARRAARAQILAEVARYARAGRFPKNRDFPGSMVPYFIDAEGTRCAVAHLVESTGDAGLAAAVATTHNNAFVREFEANLAFTAWLDRVGLTAAEAARIQPSYCFINKADACLCNTGNTPTVVEATMTVVSQTTTGRATIDVVHGDASKVMVGQEIDVGGAPNATVGAHVLVGLWASDGPTQPVGEAHLIDGDLVELSCTNVPKLHKDDAINAMLSMGDPTDTGSACGAYLTSVDAEWGKSQCDETPVDGSGGCALSTTTAPSPLLLGTLLVGAAVWARRRMKRRPARRAQRA